MPTGMTRIKGPKSNEIGRVVSKPPSREYAKNYDVVFRKRSEERPDAEFPKIDYGPLNGKR